MKQLSVPSNALVLAVVLGLGTVTSFASPAAADGGCGSFQNVGHVMSRNSDVIEQLQHDGHDYGGHRLNAISD